MKKMYLVNADQYASLKRGAPKGASAEEAPDVQLAKFQDAYVRERDEKKIRDSQDWEKLSSRLKPILSTSHKEMQEVIDMFPRDEQNHAQFVLGILSRLPKVALTPNRLLIDGVPMDDSLFEIVQDILRNDVRGIESLIHTLRIGRKVKSLSRLQPPPKSAFEPSPMKSTPQTPVSTPLEVSPIKTRAQRKKVASPMGPVRSPVIGKVRHSPLPSHRSPLASKVRQQVQRSPLSAKVQRSPPPAKVQRSPVSARVVHSPLAQKVQHSPKEDKKEKNESAIGYWFNFS